MVPERPILEPQLFRFGMRQLLLFVAAVAALCALLAASGGAWRIIISALVALAAAHVFGTVVGTRLRDSSRDLQRWKSQGPPGSRDEPVATPPPIHWSQLGLPAATPLAHCESAPRRSQAALAAGMTLGAASGAAAIEYGLGQSVSWAGVAMGAVSCGVIGAWAALAAASFYAIARRTWKQASNDASPDR
jgi:hypothetical protein